LVGGIFAGWCSLHHSCSHTFRLLVFVLREELSRLRVSGLVTSALRVLPGVSLFSLPVLTTAFLPSPTRPASLTVELRALVSALVLSTSSALLGLLLADVLATLSRPFQTGLSVALLLVSALVLALM
jgi:hypothetical protein